MRVCALLITLLTALACQAGSVVTVTTDTTVVAEKQVRARVSGHQLRNPILNALYQFVKEFSRVDTNYVEPQHYSFTVMLQNTNTYEAYYLANKAKQSIMFSPKPSVKLGPYVGWRWVFLGYTVDLTHLGSDDKKQDLNLSLYSNQIGLDLFYRKSGNDYTITRLNLGDDIDTRAIKGASFDGLHSSITGGNLYYIFNHRKFSYPAAYSQSTVQRRTAGSPMLGIGYTRHSLEVDWEKLGELVEQRLGSAYGETSIDSSLKFSKVKYTDYSISGGYGINWVFAYNWLFNASLMGSLSYKRSTSDVQQQSKDFFRDFDFKNINLDGVLRLGLVWNNTRWYAGGSAVFHAYNYRKEQFRTNNIFGSVNIYFGYNFGRR